MVTVAQQTWTYRPERFGAKGASRTNGSAAGASSGASVGLQLLTGQDVNWAQVAANAVVSGLAAWHKGVQMRDHSAATAQAAGAAAGRSSHWVDHLSIKRDAMRLPEKFVQKYGPIVGPQLKKAGLHLNDIRYASRSLGGPQGTQDGGIYNLVVLVDPSADDLNKVLLHEIAHMVQKRLMPGAVEGQNRFIHLEAVAWGRKGVYNQGFTPLPGVIPRLGDVPLADLNLVSGSYPLEALAKAWAEAVLRSVPEEVPIEAGDPARYF